MNRLLSISVFIITIGITLLLPFSLSANIGENFEKAGYLIDGAASFEIEDIGDYFDINAFGSGRFGIFMVDNLLVLFGSGYQYGSYGHGPLIFAGIDWYFGYDPGAETGLVHSLGLYTHHIFDISGESSYSMFLIPDYSLNFFITHRIAPRLTFSPSFLVFGGEFRFNTSIEFGFSYYLPTKDRVLIKR